MIDRSVAFISSANFTLAAQQRNIVGVVLRESPLAARLADQFEGLVARGLLCPVPLRARP